MLDKRVHLKVKVKSLAAEARIIRKEERKAKGCLRMDLADHRKNVVRKEARATQLAYGFIRGKQWTELERNARTEPNIRRIYQMVEKYGRQWDYENESFASFQKEKEAETHRVKEWYIKRA